MLHLAENNFTTLHLYEELEENMFQNFKELCSLMCEQRISAEKLKLQKKKKENNKIIGDSEKIVEKHLKKSWLKSLKL